MVFRLIDQGTALHSETLVLPVQAMSKQGYCLYFVTLEGEPEALPMLALSPPQPLPGGVVVLDRLSTANP